MSKKEHSVDDVLTEYNDLLRDKLRATGRVPKRETLMWAISEAARRREAYELRDTIGSYGMVIEDALNR